MMNQEFIIKKQIEMAGKEVRFSEYGWDSAPFRAVVTHLWRRKSSDFEPKFTEIGAAYSQYYLYIGSSEHDITSLSDDALLVMDGEKYEFKCKDAVFFDNRIIYYTGILRALKENSDYEI